MMKTSIKRSSTNETGQHRNLHGELHTLGDG